ncbi:hypothetical protein [Polaromonas sp. CG_9.11]|uniref:hypothetical protein n=1 Tax=Polaromonas sp. CG_9.11 TaxID=2787730 RepID=UPI0018CA44E8|nr:hypothetical protein [Polaromonas sp. CG_9.11]MBG6074315.1 hypothetical protein [Polaromonas sp. CG_9.11]
MKSKTSLTMACKLPGALASSCPHVIPDHDHHSVLPGKQDRHSESERNHRVPPVEPDIDQARVIGEKERPQPSSEKPEAS